MLNVTTVKLNSHYYIAVQVYHSHKQVWAIIIMSILVMQKFNSYGKGNYTSTICRVFDSLEKRKKNNYQPFHLQQFCVHQHFSSTYQHHFWNKVQPSSECWFLETGSNIPAHITESTCQYQQYNMNDLDTSTVFRDVGVHYMYKITISILAISIIYTLTTQEEN